MLFCPKDGPLSNYDRPNLHYDRANLREVPSTLHISTVVMAKRTVVIVENAQKRGKSPILTSEKQIDIYLDLVLFLAKKMRFIQ